MNKPRLFSKIVIQGRRKCFENVTGIWEVSLGECHCVRTWPFWQDPNTWLLYMYVLLAKTMSNVYFLMPTTGTSIWLGFKSNFQHINTINTYTVTLKLNKSIPITSFAPVWQETVSIFSFKIAIAIDVHTILAVKACKASFGVSSFQFYLNL